MQYSNEWQSLWISLFQEGWSLSWPKEGCGPLQHAFLSVASRPILHGHGWVTAAIVHPNTCPFLDSDQLDEISMATSPPVPPLCHNYTCDLSGFKSLPLQAIFLLLASQSARCLADGEHLCLCSERLLVWVVTSPFKTKTKSEKHATQQPKLTRTTIKVNNKQF